MLSLALETVGFEVRPAAGTAEAVRWLASNMPVVVVLDLQNDTEALSTLRALRSRQRFARLPILFLAARPSDDVRCRALEAGADWFSFKPLSLRELQERVGDLATWGRPRLGQPVPPGRQQRLAG